MNNQEKWTRWEPAVNNLEGNYYLDKVEDEIDSLKIILSHVSTKQKIELFFDTSVWSYRTTYESFRHGLFCMLSSDYGADFYAKWAFFKVDSSNYIKWIIESSAGITNGEYMTHFVIKTMEYVVDVVAFEEPLIKLNCDDEK